MLHARGTAQELGWFLSSAPALLLWVSVGEPAPPAAHPDTQGPVQQGALWGITQTILTSN